MPFDNVNSEVMNIEQVSLLKYKQAVNEQYIRSVIEDDVQRNFLEQELQFVMNKFKLN